MTVYSPFHFPFDDYANIRYKILCSIHFPVLFQEITTFMKLKNLEESSDISEFLGIQLEHSITEIIIDFI